MIAAVVFFLLFALGEDKDKSALPALVAAGLVYGSFAISLSVPRIAALAAGLPLVGADFHLFLSCLPGFSPFVRR